MKHDGMESMCMDKNIFFYKQREIIQYSHRILHHAVACTSVVKDRLENKQDTLRLLLFVFFIICISCHRYVRRV
jgi:hypothetical protein